MIRDYILAIDEGSSRAIVFDTDMTTVSLAQEEFPHIYPADGWVEHGPDVIWPSILRTSKRAFAEAEAK